MERRFTKQGASLVELEERDDHPPKINGYAAVYYDGTERTEYKLFDDLIERIMPGTFDRAVKERDDVRGLFNHDPDNLLGRSSSGTLALSSDDVGLRYVIDAGNTNIANDVAEHIRRGDLSGSSFAFRITDQEFKTEDDIDIREITGVELFDVGPVTYPAYDATSTGVRSADDLSECRADYDAWKASKGVDVKAKNTQRMARARAVEVGA